MEVRTYLFAPFALANGLGSEDGIREEIGELE